jgi:putative DNA primase/helicase
MERFKVPAGVERVTVFADVDQNYTGEAAAFALAKRLSLQGIACDVRHDCPRGTDYNDLLLRGIRETA